MEKCLHAILWSCSEPEKYEKVEVRKKRKSTKIGRKCFES